MNNLYIIKYIDYFDKDDPGVKVYTYSSPNFQDIYDFYNVLTSGGVEKTGYLLININKTFENKIKQLENL